MMTAIRNKILGTMEPAMTFVSLAVVTPAYLASLNAGNAIMSMKATRVSLPTWN